jgi:anti-anti-sigma factor
MAEEWAADQGEPFPEHPAWGGQFDLACQPFFWIETAELGDAVIIMVGGAVDVRTADRFAGALRSALVRRAGVMIIDVSRAEVFAAAGVRMLDGARSLAGSGGQTLRLVVDEQGLLVRMLSAAGLTGSWKLFCDLGSALEAGKDCPGEVVRFG